MTKPIILTEQQRLDAKLKSILAKSSHTIRAELTKTREKYPKMFLDDNEYLQQNRINKLREKVLLPFFSKKYKQWF